MFRPVSIILTIALVATAASALENWPESQDFERWAAKILKIYSDPAVKCNKVTGIDSTTPGAIRLMGIWCAEADGVASHGMIVTVKLMGDTINGSFRREFPKVRGPIAISLWNRDGSVAFGSKDWP